MTVKELKKALEKLEKKGLGDYAVIVATRNYSDYEPDYDVFDIIDADRDNTPNDVCLSLDRRYKY